MTDRSDQPDIHDLRRQIETLWAAYLDPQIGGLELAEMIAAQTLHLPNRKAWREIGSKLGGRNLTSAEWLSLRQEAWDARKRQRRQLAQPDV
jgi:hypothetical protein